MAGSRGVKKRSHEKLTDSNIQHVIWLLNAKSPITKKEACSILNISYNTTRLKTIIEEFVEKKKGKILWGFINKYILYLSNN